MNNDLYRKDSENLEEYFNRLCRLKFIYDMTWPEIAELANSQCGTTYSGDKFRKQSKRLGNFEESFTEVEKSTEVEDKLLELRKERYKLSDERTQNNALIRRMAREDTIKEMAFTAAQEIAKSIQLPPVHKITATNGGAEAILEISDWHFGIDIDTYFNVYNPSIARKRIIQLRDAVISNMVADNVKKLYVVNLGDLIAGRIHLQLRLNSQFDVITQIEQVSELLAELLNDLSEYAEIHYYDCLDNHSRLEPNKSDSVDLESLARITPWYLKTRLAANENVILHDNTYGDDIITFEAMGYKIAGVHGDKDKPNNVINNISMLTQQHYDLVLAAHLHHFSANEQNETIVVSNGSLMGTDDYAIKLRLNSKPSQTMIVMSKNNVIQTLYKIDLN